MARRSTVEADPRVRAEIDAAIARGQTLDDIVAALRRMGSDISRSSVGRYAKNYRDLAARERDIQAVAKTYAADFGGDTNQVGKLLIQLVTSMATRQILDTSEDDAALKPADLHFFARAVKDLIAAAKIDTDRDAAVRKEERERAAKSAESAARRAGVSAADIDLIRREILGTT